MPFCSYLSIQEPELMGRLKKRRETKNAGMGHVPNPTMGKKPNAEAKNRGGESRGMIRWHV
jgi:hypothetical protein